VQRLPFRFGVLGTPQQGAERWVATARRAEQLGFATLLMPDGASLPSPLPALAIAAGATSTLRVGTFVLASPYRPPRLAAWDAHTLAELTGGRFEFGIGTGRPEAVAEAVRLTGGPPPSAARRLELAEQAIDALGELDGSAHTPVLMAAAGPRALRLAAAKADIVTLATSPLASRAEIAKLAAGLRQQAGERAGQLELAMNVFVIGDEVPGWIGRVMGVDGAQLAASDSLARLGGSPAQMADELRRRRDQLGFSYVVVNAAYLEQAAPLVDQLAGT
jgi:alkanesulfonate monooxygenase SsuD/methylene tetrahydromethanopterin reductase-like flavin-dependent oxidoreductase (luciferase family)